MNGSIFLKKVSSGKDTKYNHIQYYLYVANVTQCANKQNLCDINKAFTSQCYHKVHEVSLSSNEKGFLSIIFCFLLCFLNKHIDILIDYERLLLIDCF